MANLRRPRRKRVRPYPRLTARPEPRRNATADPGPTGPDGRHGGPVPTHRKYAHEQEGRAVTRQINRAVQRGAPDGLMRDI